MDAMATMTKPRTFLKRNILVALFGLLIRAVLEVCIGIWLAFSAINTFEVKSDNHAQYVKNTRG